MTGEKKARKIRSDKGDVRITKRDFECIEWVAHQYAARGDQIQRLLSRYPDPTHPFQDELASDSTTREQIGRWVRAGWVVYKRVLAKGPGWAYVTRAGLRLVGLDKEYSGRAPIPRNLEHIYAINQVRLWMEEEKNYHWTSERRYIASLGLKRGQSSGPIPDGFIIVDEARVAIEVQISELKQLKWEAKLSALFKHRVNPILPTKVWDEIWVYVPKEEMKKSADEARMKLDDPDRVDVIVDDELLMPEATDSWS